MGNNKKTYFLISSNVNDDIINLEICEFIKIQKYKYLENKVQFFLQIKKNHLLGIKDYIMTK